MELTIMENRRYHVSEVRANRTDTEQFALPYLTSVKLAEGGESSSLEGDDDLKSVFTKHGKGVDLTDTIAYRITFATPTYILFKHHLNITMMISFVDDSPNAADALIRPPLNNSNNSSTSTLGINEEIATPTNGNNNNTANSLTIQEQAAQAAFALAPPPAAFSISSSNTNTHIRQPIVNVNTSNPPPIIHPHNPHNNQSSNPYDPHSSAQLQSTWLSKLRKPVNTKEGGAHVIRKRETIRLETPVTIFDCRLKEDYGRLPSYSELNVTVNPAHGDDKNRLLPDMIEQDLMLQCIPDSDRQMPSSEPQPQLCPCYFKFRRQMEMASQAQLLTANSSTPTLERIPSIPPPDYVETA
ncbi:unnamed protein product [Mucor hiemalis]